MRREIAIVIWGGLFLSSCATPSPSTGFFGGQSAFPLQPTPTGVDDNDSKGFFAGMLSGRSEPKQLAPRAANGKELTVPPQTRGTSLASQAPLPRQAPQAPAAPLSQAPATEPAAQAPSSGRASQAQGTRRGEEIAAALGAQECARYAVALMQCYIATEPYKNDAEKFATKFRDCLVARKFPSEPKVCERTIVSPEEAASIVLQRRFADFRSFFRNGRMLTQMRNASRP